MLPLEQKISGKCLWRSSSTAKFSIWNLLSANFELFKYFCTFCTLPFCILTFITITTTWRKDWGYWNHICSRSIQPGQVYRQHWPTLSPTALAQSLCCSLHYRDHLLGSKRSHSYLLVLLYQPFHISSQFPISLHLIANLPFHIPRMALPLSSSTIFSLSTTPGVQGLAVPTRGTRHRLKFPLSIDNYWWLLAYARSLKECILTAYSYSLGRNKTLISIRNNSLTARKKKYKGYWKAKLVCVGLEVWRESH